RRWASLRLLHALPPTPTEPSERSARPNHSTSVSNVLAMRRRWRIAAALAASCLAACARGPGEPPPPAADRAPGQQTFDLVHAFDSNRLHVVNRNLEKIHPTAVRLSSADGNGVAWIARTEFSTGTIDVDVRGKDVLQESFVGVAFHGKDDKTYEAVYLRPFNFRATDPDRHGHAIQ